MKHHPHLHLEPLEDRIAPAGIVTVTYNGGALALSGDALDNSLDVFKTGANTYRIQGLNGTLLTTGGAPVPLLDIGQLTSLTISGNAGADDFGLTDLTTLRTLSFNGGSELDLLYAQNLVVSKDVDLNLGAGGALIAFAGASTTINGNVNAIYGDGVGSVDFFSTNTFIKGTLTLTGGPGLDLFTFGQNVRVDKGLVVSDAAGGGFRGAFHSATVTLGKSTAGDSIRFNGGSGKDSLEFFGSDVTMTGDLEFHGAGDNDALDFHADALSITGKIDVSGGAGDDLLQITGQQNTIGHRIAMSGGEGADILALTASDLTVEHDIALDGGGGDDSIAVLADDLTLGLDLTVLGGGGANVASVFGDGQILGNVHIDIGGADGGDQTLLLGGISGATGALEIAGTLTIISQAADPLNQGLTDFLWVTDVTVAGNVGVTMGAVDSTVFLDNIFLSAGLSISTGDGNDSVEIERHGLLGSSTIAALAAIQLGAGDDLLLIGTSSAPGSNDFVAFSAGISANGGTGTDTSNDFLSDAINAYDAGALRQRLNFEALVI